MNKGEKRTFSVSLTREMLLDLRMMANAKSKDVLDAADRFEREGCVMTSSGFRRYSKMWTDFANELGVIYDELFMED